MEYDIRVRLDELTGRFCETFGYPREGFPYFSTKGEDLSIDEVMDAMNSLFIPALMGHEAAAYSREFHVNRVCHAIEEGTFPYQLSRKTIQLYRQHKKRRWNAEDHIYGFRLRWQIRLNRMFPGRNIRIPAIDEIVSHRILRFLSAVNCIRSRIAYAYKNKTLEDFYYMDRRYGSPILVRGNTLNLLGLFFPEKFGSHYEISKTEAISH